MMNALTPNHETTSDQKLAVTCCCFPRMGRPKLRTGEPFTVSGENDLPSLQQPTSRLALERFSTKDSITTVYDLPPGWKAVSSRSRPDRTAFLNEFTGERISWVPTEPASTVKGEIRRSKRKSRVNNERDSMRSSGSGNTVTRASFDAVKKA